MLNKIVLMGRLTRDPELRRTQQGTAVASFSLAVDRDYCGMYFLYNSKLSLALRSSGREKEEAELIAAALAAGAFCF